MDAIKKIKNKEKAIIISVSMKRSELEKIDEVVRKEKVSRSELIRTLLLDFVEKYNKNQINRTKGKHK